MMKLHTSTTTTTSLIKVATTGGLITLPNSNFPYCSREHKWSSSSLPLIAAAKFVISHRKAVCYAESSGASSTVAAETKEGKEGESAAPATKEDAAAAPEKPKPKTAAKAPNAETKEGKEGESAAPATKEDAAAAPEKPKPKTAAKAPVKALPEMMEEDVIPSLRSTLETQQDIEELELFFKDNKLEGSFLKKGIPYTFWALFPDGTLTGPKGFSISSYGSTASNVEPFLVDEKKVTAKLLVFWVEKRLAAQGIIPVWTE